LSELRRGFKAWCERVSAGYRRELGLPPHGALNPLELARLLKIQVITPEALNGLSASAANHLCVTDADSWSAVTLIEGERKLVILNPSHSAARKNSDLAHEVSHIILEHKPTQVFFGPDKTLMIREFDRVQEAEAECLSSVLLVPREALLALLTISDDEVAAQHLGVSTQMFRMRRNLTGVDRQLARRW
jgi:Zn-dependent peptidase ImmA (M78 family)